jgi:hypothetical protein
VIETRVPGYVIDAVNGELDLHRFEQLRDEGRAALTRGQPEDAARVLRQALGLWRGRPLADLENEPCARDATGRLDEAWLEALESRIEADLEAGRHAELVGELRALVRSHPLRERLRVQLMLALYRSGRQSEALDAYADARRALVDEVGLEPGPELRRLQRAILDHDPALAPEPITRSRRRRRWSLIAAVGVAAVAGAVAVAVLGRYREPPRPAVVRLGGELIAVDAGTGKVTRRIPAGRTPAAVAVADGRAWLIDADALTLMAVDTRSGAVETLATGATPTDLAAGAGSVWVANGNRIQGNPVPGAGRDVAHAVRPAHAHGPRPRRAPSVEQQRHEPGRQSRRR